MESRAMYLAREWLTLASTVVVNSTARASGGREFSLLVYGHSFGVRLSVVSTAMCVQILFFSYHFDSGPEPLPGLAWESWEISLLDRDCGFPRVLLRPSLQSHCSLMIEFSREQLLRVELELQRASQLGLEQPIGVMQMSCSVFLASKDPSVLYACHCCPVTNNCN